MSQELALSPAETLLGLSQELAAVRRELLDLDLPPEVLRDTLDGLSAPFEAKAIAVRAFSDTLEAMATVLKEQESRISARRKAMERRVHDVRAYIKSCMESSGIRVIESPEMKLQIVNLEPLLVVDNAEEIPAEYMRWPEVPEPELDRRKLLSALKLGDVPGAHLEPNTYLKRS